jgi:hypothetical protein
MSWKSQFRAALTAALVAFAFGFVQACRTDMPTTPEHATVSARETCVLINGVWHCVN